MRPSSKLCALFYLCSSAPAVSHAAPPKPCTQSSLTLSFIGSHLNRYCIIYNVAWPYQCCMKYGLCSPIANVLHTMLPYIEFHMPSGFCAASYFTRCWSGRHIIFHTLLGHLYTVALNTVLCIVPAIHYWSVHMLFNFMRSSLKYHGWTTYRVLAYCESLCVCCFTQKSKPFLFLGSLGI